MGDKENRRSFLKTSMLLGSGAALSQTCLSEAVAQKKQTDSVKFPNETIKTIQNLRTIHGNFIDKEIPDETIELILQSSIRAANASNMQSYSIVVVKDREKMKQVCTYQGSCMLLYCVDFTRLKDSAASLGHAYHPDNIVNLITAGINTAFAAQTAVIAARSLGLDCLTTNGIHRGNMERVWTLLDLPKTHCFPLIAVVIGYPTQEPPYKMGRLDGAGVIHREKYHHATKQEIEQIISACDDKARHLALNDVWDSQGHKHYLDWFFKVWAGRNATPTGTESQMFRLLRRSEFIDLQKT
jgi:nitroreductase